MMSWLQEWYLSNCDGDWEHRNQIKITNLDNPGWLVEISVEDWGKLPTEAAASEVSEDNWVYCKVEESLFIGAGGVRNLEDIIRIFQKWATENGQLV